ncbi:MAG: DUF2752 domain-containing protein [Pontiellaceae bacterium]|nr:DUF2752 domain-containing protein [Pontiellaceae bacterium]
MIISRLIVVALIGAAAFFIWQKAPEQNRAIPHCPVFQLTGFHCSGCGSLRAVHSLLHGDFARAWTMNPLTVMLLPLIAVLAAEELLLGRHRLTQQIRPAYLWILLATFIIFGIIRNLPFYPFTCLAPH